MSLQNVMEKVEDVVGISDTTPIGGSPPFTPRAKKVLELSLREALQLGHKYIGTEHLLLGLLREGDGVAARVLVSLGVDLTSVREQVMRVLDDYQGSEAEGTPMTRHTIRRPRLFDPEQDTFTERVGKEWTARVVRAGRTPPDYEAAYEELEDLHEGVGIAFDDPEVTGVVVRSIDTNQGPGLELSISHRVEDEPDSAQEDGVNEEMT